MQQGKLDTPRSGRVGVCKMNERGTGGARWDCDILSYVCSLHHVVLFLYLNLLYLPQSFAARKYTKAVLNLQVLPLTLDVVVASFGTKQMQMLDHVRNLVKSMECFTPSGDMAPDPAGLFTPKKCELGTYANKSCGPGSVHECCKLGFFTFGGKEGLRVCICICGVAACWVIFID